jgi:hypothetical protein
MPLSVSTVGFGVQTQLIGQESQVFLLIFFYIPVARRISPLRMTPPFGAA